ncbi:hypothetical protein CEXT_265911 [Caerostris extrusa]|uniref:Uncharacterized protein n=1 Tax=Caerostris extrusa TaxID=172846 RepID=A0AAV4WK65_CAEEX|nr:hypothetical protein CEXT_265911 [Caerostris extrusa]
MRLPPKAFVCFSPSCNAFTLKKSGNQSNKRSFNLYSNRTLGPQVVDSALSFVCPGAHPWNFRKSDICIRRAPSAAFYSPSRTFPLFELAFILQVSVILALTSFFNENAFYSGMFLENLTSIY